MKISLKHFVAALSINTALTGCAGVVSKPVLETNKDPSFQYDGIYIKHQSNKALTFSESRSGK